MNVNLSGAFSDPFTQQVDQAYHQQFNQGSLYSNALYITLVYKGIDSGKFGKTLNILQKLNHKAVKNAREAYREEAVAALKKATHQMIASLGVFKPHLLGSRDEVLGYSELLSFLGLFVNAMEPLHFRSPHFAGPMVSGVQGAEEALSRYPKGNIAYYLPTKRLFFGDFIEFQGPSDQSTYGAILSIKQYADQSAPVMLDKLLHLDCEFIQTNSFFVEDMSVAQGRIKKQLIRMHNANDPAFSQMQALEQCRDDLASDRVKVGYHHNTVMLLSHDLEHLKSAVNQAIKVYNDVLFVATSETIGLEPAFWAQIPANQRMIARSALITSENFVDFCPLHNYRTGYRDQNHLGSAVTLVETPSKTPLFFNFHAKGSGKKNDLTPGHTTIIGGNGSGKTVFMGFMDSQMTRYGGRSFFFDRDRGLELYVRAAGGQYAIISPDHPGDTIFNPFWLEDTPKNRSFLKHWMGQLVKHPDEVELPADIDAMISQCVNYAYDALSKACRNLSTVTQFLSIDFPRWNRLRKWLRGQGHFSDGEYAYLFDHDEEQLDLSQPKTGFDLTELMSEPNSVLTAVSMYLMHRVKESLDGQRVSIYFDEGWQVLDNPYWKQQLKQDLPTLRKLNSHLVLATQSPESILNSALSAQFLDNSATNIFFCNANANYDKHYRHFNVSLSEFDFIQKTPREKRLFLYKQSEESAIARLNLSGMDEALAIYSGNKSTVQLLDQLRKALGDDPKVWMPEFHQRRHTLDE